MRELNAMYITHDIRHFSGRHAVVDVVRQNKAESALIRMDSG
jgi:hypothetical protein